MKKFIFSALFIATTVTTPLMANEYQSLTSVDYAHVNSKQANTNIYGINSIYYLDKKSTLGPLDQFSYINTTSNLYGSFYDADNQNNYQLGGELFLDNWLVGANYRYLDGDNDNNSVYGMSLGYLINDNFLIKASAQKDDNDTYYQFTASYNHQLNDTDYIGFTYNTDENFDTQTLSSKYFMALNNEQYLTLGLAYSKNEYWNNILTAQASYYFTPKTSVNVSYNDEHDYSISAKHYLNSNIALSVGYQSNASNSNEPDYDLYTANLSMQF